MRLQRFFSFRSILSVILFCLILPANASIADGLIVHYDFETISGTTVSDVSLHDMNGVMMGSPKKETGYKGTGLTFPTNRDYLLLPNGFVNTLTNFSIATWVKINTVSNWSRIFDFGSSTSYYMFMTPSSGNNTYRFAIKNGGGAEQLVESTTPLKANEWVHVAVTYGWNPQTSTGIAKLFLNGLLVGTNASFNINPSMLPQTTKNYIAKSQFNDPALNATVDDFRIYNRTLTDAELLELNGFPSDLMTAFSSINITGDLTRVKSDLTLQTVTATGGYPVIWTTSAGDIVDITGKVTRPKLFDQNVTLTATITIMRDGNPVNLTKEFNIRVLAFENLHWESMILESDTMKYLVATSEPPADWYKSTFSDASWLSGPGGFGFGDNDDKTVIAQCTSVYIRKKIEVSDLSKIENLLLDIDYDDAFILYINGVERARSANVSGVLPAFNTTPSIEHEATMYKGGSPERFVLKPSFLVNGTNLFAIQVINRVASNQDMTSRVFIHTKILGEGTKYNQVPTWFSEPISFETSNLPFVLINTNGLNIIANTKIMADMKVVNSPLKNNNINDTIFEYNGKIGIEIRGNSSAGFPKKSYTVETRNELGENLSISFLGLPKENDWVFHGPYPDKSLMRNVLAYHLGNLTGKWSPRTRFFELYLNGAYKGVYVLVEKIKIDKNRSNLSTLKPEDISGDDVTGGYILKLDRPEKTGVVDVENKDYWISPYRAWTTLQQRVYFLFHDPKGDVLKTEQFNYIKKHLTDFENAMYSDNYKDKVNGYFPMVDLNSFLDYYILNELSRNLDGYRISTFIQKDKDSKGGKITMGPYWDYDICFGNANFFSAGLTDGWIIDGMGNADEYAMPFWWQKFRVDPYFNSQLKARWNEWKGRYINTTYLNHYIDSCAYELVDAQKRNFQTWNILNVSVWPNNYVGGTYANEISYMKNWISKRITWMDTQIQAIPDLPSSLTTENFPMDLVTYPNPFTEMVQFKFYLASAGKIELRIVDLMGRNVYSKEETLDAGMHELPVTATEMGAQSKVYIYQMKVDGKVRKSGKLIRLN